nr:hypothetical protein [uncultured Anaeromusa sp.]
MSKEYTQEDLIELIAKALVDTGVEGPYDAVTCTTSGGDYPSLGMSQWEGERSDLLLSYIEGGETFAGRAYSDLRNSGDIPALKELLDSAQGHAAQDLRLREDIRDMYLPFLLEAGLTNAACIVYAGVWCPTSHVVVRNFIRRRAERGYDVNDLGVLNGLFFEQYADAAYEGEYQAGTQNRANATMAWVMENLA